jgi:antitoxin MazE
MEARVSKWGNSLGLRIPLSMAKATGLIENTSVELSIKNNEIIIAKSKTYKLSELLSKVTSKNKHNETDTGSAVGNEVW